MANPLRWQAGLILLATGARATTMAYGHGDSISAVFSVDDVVAGGRVHRGNCDFNDAAPDCPYADVPNPEAHWDPEASGASCHPPPRTWFQTCLTTEDDPPKALTWVGTGP